MKVAMVEAVSAGVFLFGCFVILGADASHSVDMGKQLTATDAEGQAILREETTFHVNGQTSDSIRPLDTPYFLRSRRSEAKECNIVVQKVEMQSGRCTKLADSTPACHNDQYLAINYEDC